MYERNMIYDTIIVWDLQWAFSYGVQQIPLNYYKYAEAEVSQEHAFRQLFNLSKVTTRGPAPLCVKMRC